MLIISGVLVMVLATAGFAISGFKNHYGRSHEKGFVKEKVLSHMDYTMQELKLSPVQQAKYSAIREKMSMGMEGAIERHSIAKDAMHAELDRPQPNLKALAASLKKEVEAMPMTVTVQIDYMIEVYDILDTNQQQQLVQKLKEHMADKDCS